jgi:hypothetical protein
MANRRFDQPIEPMTLGNMRELGVRSLDVFVLELPVLVRKGYSEASMLAYGLPGRDAGGVGDASQKPRLRR